MFADMQHQIWCVYMPYIEIKAKFTHQTNVYTNESKKKTFWSMNHAHIIFPQYLEIVQKQQVRDDIIASQSIGIFVKNFLKITLIFLVTLLYQLNSGELIIELQ